MTYDVAIIGSGIVGSCIARELSKYKLQVCMIEKCDDVSCGTSKANSGIIHGGYDPVPGSLMAKLNVEGTAQYEKLSQQLHFEYKKTGSLVVGFSDEDMAHVQKLYDRGLKNGVPGMKILSEEELKEKEPSISENAKGALFCESAGIVSPYQATWAFAENAVNNGVKLFLETEVHAISAPETRNGYWTIHTGQGEISSRVVVNAAGLYADKISEMAGARNFVIKPRRGEYFLLDNKCSGLANHTLFQTPDNLGKGVLVTPTVDGNILVGPSADDNSDRENTATTRSGQDLIMKKAEKTIPDIPRRNIINSFSGIRAIAYNPDGSPVNDFIIEEDSVQKCFINVAGICSPGLSAAPAIGRYVAELVENAMKKSGALDENKGFEKNPDFVAVRKGIESFKEASDERKAQLIEENALYGRIICRCEMITEAEIVQAINSPVGARDLDGVKRRTRAGMGRCQSGFCSPRVTEIISRERKIPMTSVTKCGGCSYILNSKTR